MTNHNRRKSHRLKLNFCGDMGADHPVVHPDAVHDLSLGGLAFVADNAYEVGRIIHLAITLPNLEGGDDVEARCEVRESHAVEGGRYRTGVRFLEFAEQGEERLHDYLERVFSV